MSAQGMRPGGMTDDEKVPDSDVNGAVAKLSTEIKTMAMANLVGGQTNANFKDAKVEVLSYKSQLVAGVNYFAKVKISGMIFHARIYKDLSGDVSLNKVVGPKQESVPIGYF